MALRLEVFETEAEKAKPELVVTDQGQIEEAKLAAYESGYSAGWEDAVSAQSEDQGRMKSDLARNLQALSFTYHEVRGHILSALDPLIRDLVGRLLPALARETLGRIVAETLAPLAAQQAEVPLVLVINPAARPSVEAALGDAFGLPLTIEDEPSLGEGQAYLRFASTETRIDLDRAVAEIIAAVRDFFALARQEAANG